MLRKLASLLAVFALLSGCQSTNTAGSISDFQVNRQTSGLVLMSTTVNTGEIPPLSVVTVKSLMGKKSEDYLLYNQIGGKSHSTSLFWGSLPAGEYRISKVAATIPGGSKYLNIYDASVLGTFTVKAGEVADLGRLVFSALDLKAGVGRSQYIVSNDELVARFFPTEQVLQTATFHGWSKPHQEIDVVEAFALVHPQGVSNFSELTNGKIIAGTRMGMTLIRSEDGKWRTLSSNKNLHQIVATAAFEQGDEIAVLVDEFGLLYTVSDEGKLTEVNKGNLPDGKVDFIHSSPDYRQWFVALTRDGFTELYQSSNLQQGEWRQINRAEVGMNTWDGMRYGIYWRRPNGIGFSASVDGSVKCYDFASGNWTENSTPDKRPVIAVAAAASNDYVGILTGAGGGFAGVFAKTHYSANCGQTWTETDSPYSVKASAPLVLREDLVLEVGGVFSDEGIYASKNGGLNWFKISNENALSDKLWTTKNHGLFLVSNGAYGFEMIQNSQDDGATWALELTSLSSHFFEQMRKEKEAK